MRRISSVRRVRSSGRTSQPAMPSVEAEAPPRGADEWLMGAGPTCAWCGEAYKPGGRGKPQRFCSAAHRRAYEQAARDWVRQAIADGLLTVLDLRAASRTTRAFVGAPSGSRDGRSGPRSAGGLAAGSRHAAAPEGPKAEKSASCECPWACRPRSERYPSRFDYDRHICRGWLTKEHLGDVVGKAFDRVCCCQRQLLDGAPPVVEFDGRNLHRHVDAN